MAGFNNNYGSYSGYGGGHSGHDMRQKLERMMQEADSEREKQALREVLNKI